MTANKKELDKILDATDPEGIDEKGARRNIIDWDEVVGHFADSGWFTVGDVQTYAKTTYEEKDKPVYYSEILRVIRQTHKNKDYHVTKKRVKSGALKGVYYKIEEI